MRKKCSKCGLERDYVDFYKNRRTLDGFRSDCKTCHTKIVREYQKTTRGIETVKAAEVSRTGSDKRKTSHNKASIKYKKTSKGRLTSKLANIRRRELKEVLDSSFTKKDIVTTHNLFENKCFACGTTHNLSLDHHRPLSKGHGLSNENAVVLCVSCNSSKGNKMPEDFYNKEQLKVLRGIGVI